MPGIATQFVVLERVIDRLGSSPDPALRKAANVLTANPAYAYLGAVGPSLADFIPSDPPAPGGPATPSSAHASLWTQVLAIAGGDGTSADPGAVHVINEYRRLLDKLDGIVADEDLGALKQLRDSGETAAIETLADQLKTLVTGLLPRVAAIGAAITTGMRPAVNVASGSPIPAPVVWSARDWLHWKHPGRFAAALLDRARASGDDRFLAYALGYLCSFSGCVAINPFINSVVGGAYRHQWWRTRWVSNYIDVWVHGAYRTPATMAGDTPSPAYADWTSLCDAKLHQRIELAPVDPIAVMAGLRAGDAFPAILPQDFADFWMDAWRQAYGTPSVTSRFRASALNGAFVMTYMMLWFQTSGDVVGCAPAPLGAPPATCGGAPSWVDPNVPGDGGTGTGPKLPEPESDPDVGEIVTGAILALLGAAGMIFGAGAIGAAALVGGIALMVDGAIQIDWDKLRCDLYWLRAYLNNGLRALHDLLTLGGFSHAYPSELALDTTTITLLGVPYTFDSGKRIAKSRPLFPEELVGHVGVDPVGSFPCERWDGGLGTWVQTPDSSPAAIERPPTTGYLRAVYPSFVIDDAAANGLTADNDAKTGAAGPDGVRHVPGTPVPVTFANAVDNAIDLIAMGPARIPDWNLDADRGLAWLTWQVKGGIYADPVPVEAEP